MRNSTKLALPHFFWLPVVISTRRGVSGGKWPKNLRGLNFFFGPLT